MIGESSETKIRPTMLAVCVMFIVVVSVRDVVGGPYDKMDARAVPIAARGDFANYVELANGHEDYNGANDDNDGNDGNNGGYDGGYDDGHDGDVRNRYDELLASLDVFEGGRGVGGTVDYPATAPWMKDLRARLLHRDNVLNGRANGNREEASHDLAKNVQPSMAKGEESRQAENWMNVDKVDRNGGLNGKDGQGGQTKNFGHRHPHIHLPFPSQSLSSSSASASSSSSSSYSPSSTGRRPSPSTSGDASSSRSPEVHEEFAIYAPNLSAGNISILARQLGYSFRGQVGQLDGYYVLSRRKLSKNDAIRNKRGGGLTSMDHLSLLSKDARIHWAERQVILQRRSRTIVDKRQELEAYKRAHYNDVDWLQQWYLYDGNEVKEDLRVVGVWDKNITGKGVVVTVLDDGIEHNHTDLRANYDPRASYDFNDNDPDPFPRYNAQNTNKHGTRCAGEVAMEANNRICGVGIAHQASIGGIRMLDGPVTDSLEAKALTHAIDHIDIFSASWGPLDDGVTVEGPGRLASAALKLGTSKGRRGLGVLYVWASGNGGGFEDNCDCDGYSGSIYTISISSASQQLRSPWYAEHCASTLATTYSSGTSSDRKIVSTDLHNKCTDSHTGTSASAPLAAGMLALVLQTNPELTWRDVQHLIVWTSGFQPLKHNQGWKTNAAGFKVNSRFGFGLLNAVQLVNWAQGFSRVPEAHLCRLHPIQTLPTKLGRSLSLSFRVSVDNCPDVRYLEHIELYLNVAIRRRGSLSIDIESPKGTKTTLLSPRPKDKSDKGFTAWPFMSLHTWGEDPSGIWVVSFKIVEEDLRGEVNNATLLFHGTSTPPKHVLQHGTRNYGAQSTTKGQGDRVNAPGPSGTRGKEGVAGGRGGDASEEVRGREGVKPAGAEPAKVVMGGGRGGGGGGGSRVRGYVNNGVRYYDDDKDGVGEVGRGTGRTEAGANWADGPWKKSRHIHRQRNEQKEQSTYNNLRSPEKFLDLH